MIDRTVDGAAALVHTVPADLLIGGRWRPSSSGATFAVMDPATGLELRRVADATPADGVDALAAADAARHEWAATPPRTRAELLDAACSRLAERRDAFAALVTSEMGKPVAEARGEVDYAADYLQWFAEEAVRIEGGYRVAPHGDGRMLTMRHPVGPCLLIAPWNFPIAMGARKIAPALAAGCTAVAKPALRPRSRCSRSPRSSRRSGFPPACSTSSRPPTPRRSRARCCVTRACASSRSPGRPPSAACSPSAPGIGCCGCRWSSAATRRSSCSTMPISTPPSKAR